MYITLVRSLVICCAVAWVASAAGLSAQLPVTPAHGQQITADTSNERPRPYPVFETSAFAIAVARGTRTHSGMPGTAYWQQYAKYRIDAQLIPESKQVHGRETIVYVNNSPDTLRRVAVYLRQNLFAAGAERNVPAPITGGMKILSVSAAGRMLAERGQDDSTPGYTVSGTVAWITLPRPLAPRGDTLTLRFSWSFTSPPAPSDTRQGQDGDVFMIGYWYPQMAVYDDVSGWVTDPYRGRAEFYMGYGDYDVRLTVPAGWLVGSTGTLENAADVLTASTRDRLTTARRSCNVVHVVTADGRGAGRATSAGTHGMLAWRFRAHDVRDFAWATSASYLWDATCAHVGTVAHPDTADIYSFYRPAASAAAWTRGAEYNRKAIEFLSRYLWPFPYPQMTAVEGVIPAGGMEYPMLTDIQSYKDTVSLEGDLMHEDGHMWFPMQVGSNETRYPWMDEGLTQFNSVQGMKQVYGIQLHAPMRRYLELVQGGEEAPVMRHGDLFPNDDAYFVTSYYKTTSVLVALHAILGDSAFLRAYREYGKRWTGKHPEPYDFFATMNSVTGQDLSWFWRSWFYETWPLDQAIASVSTLGDSASVVIQDRGLVPMPVLLSITREDGTMQRLVIPVTVWLTGARQYTVRVGAKPGITRVEIDPDQQFPDIDRTNQVWQLRQ